MKNETNNSSYNMGYNMNDNTKNIYMSDNMKSIYFCRAPRDKQHPYMQLFRKLPQDKDLTFEERGLLIFLLSLPENCVTDLVKVGRENGIGRNKIFRIVKKYERLGYCEIKGGLFEKSTYIFHEEKIVKIDPTDTNEPSTGNQDTAHNECGRVLDLGTPKWVHENEYTEPEKQQPSNSASHINTIDTFSKRKEEEQGAAEAAREISSSESNESKKTKTSQAALDLEKQFIAEMKSKDPCWNAPNSHYLAHQCDLMFKDGRTPQQIINLVRWLLNNEFQGWAGALFNPRSNPGTILRKNFSQWYVRMNSKSSQRKFGHSATDEATAYILKSFEENCD